ncbi:MAG TPA: hypothetical protein DCX06_00370 [Opitutae bacterium]|nr:hypothetical protein [Opitutae bacterium]
MSFVFQFKETEQHVFIHIPKNGGTALVEALMPFNPYKEVKKRRPNRDFVGHLTYRETTPLMTTNFTVRYFCIIRNPWSRMVSLYHYLKQTNPKVHGYHDLHKPLKKGLRFDEFVSRIITDPENRFKAQIDYMTDAQGALAIDHILSLENLEADANCFLQEVGIDIAVEVPRSNTSKHTNYREYYTSPDTIEAVADFERGIHQIVPMEF